MATKKPIVSVVLEEEINRKLKEISKEKGISVSKLVSSLLAEALYLEENVFKDEIYQDTDKLSKEWKEKLPVLFTKVLDTTPDPIWIKDNNLRYIYVNKAFEEIFGKTKDEFIGKSDIEVLPPENAKECVYTDMVAIEKDAPTQSYEKVKVNGEEKIYNVIKTPIKDKNGNLISILGIGRDITNFQKINEELEQRNKALEEAYQKLKQVYEFDYLTGFYNRGKFIEILDIHIQKLKEQENPEDEYLVLMDVCNLEHANELYGFQFGDNVVKEIARILNRISPALGEAIFGRISGRTFAMLIKPKKEITEVIKTIDNSVSDIKVILNNEVFKFSPKMFFTIRNLSQNVPLLSAENLLFCVETTMASAKESDELTNFHIIEPNKISQEDTLNKYVQLIDKFVRKNDASIKIDEIKDLQSRETKFINIVGGIHDGKRFIDVVEIYKSNIRGQNFFRLNQIFLEKVRKEVYPKLEHKAFLDIGAFIVYDSIFPESDILKNILFMKDKIIFTVCESVITNNKKAVLMIANDYNIKFAINNIGFGNTSLKNLMEFADLGILEHIKFYPEVFKKAINNNKERAFIEGIISFAKGLGIKTIATSLDTEEELEFAKNIGIDFAQGKVLEKVLI